MQSSSQREGRIMTGLAVWQAIDALARSKGWSPCQLAVRAGLDPTALNPSKRTGTNGKMRWPSTETVSKLLDATDTSLSEFARLVEDPEHRSAVASHAGTEILILDEDSRFREFACAALLGAGYRVYEAADHRDALEVIAMRSGLALLCTDIVMPAGVGGIAMLRIARRLLPELRGLYITQYDLPAWIAPAVAEAGIAILRKPVAEPALLEAVTEALEALPVAPAADRNRQRRPHLAPVTRAQPVSSVACASSSAK